MLDGVQGREGSKQSTSVIQDLSDQYGYKPGKRAGAKGGWAKVKEQSHPECNMGGAAMKTKGYAKGGAAMKTKGAAKGGVKKAIIQKDGIIRAQIVAYLQSNIPHFKCWVRKEYTHNHEKYHGEFIHAMAIAVTTMPTRCLSFQVIFTGAETYDDDERAKRTWRSDVGEDADHRTLVADTPLDDWPEAMPVWACQPWDCSSYNARYLRA